MRVRPDIILITLTCLANVAACKPVEEPHTHQQPDAEQQAAGVGGEINPRSWPKQAMAISRDPEIEKRIDQLLARMTLEEKVGQIIQADISAVTPDQVRKYNLGSVLNGGGSAPGNDNRAAPDRWLALADAFWDASTDTSDGGAGIPAIWGTDAVHGHSNILGATIFPHNIGLGMAGNPDMMYDIGRATALQMLATGLDWTFAPTIAVARNDRWGRTYESYSESPELVAAYAPRIIEGIQGKAGTVEFLGPDRMIATAKHFIGDGGTLDGVDQGDNVATEQELRTIHAAGYPPAIAAGVQTVMASFNSYHGRKLHGHPALLGDVLVGRMGLDGFVVGDWNGHGQVAGCSNTSCAAAFNAGLDMFMAPDSWEGLFHATLAQVASGDISLERLDEAVKRILRVKFRAGVFDAGRPSSRPHAGDFSLLASEQTRALARSAVRQSLVLLKNQNGLLPLRPDMRVLLAGDGAHDIGKQCGGWTLNWQGTGNRNEHFPSGMSIFEGFRQALNDAGGEAVLSLDGSYTTRPDVAVVVFGEDPYAEFQGDQPHVAYGSEDGLRLLRKFREQGIPTASVFLSGRPLWVNREINASEAFVAAWLPGTEGGGIADVLVAAPDGSPRHDFRGHLSFSWPRTANQSELNVGDAHYDPLFPFGYGLDYASGGDVPVLSEASGLSEAVSESREVFIEYGDPKGAWQMSVREHGESVGVADSRGSSPGGALTVQPADREVQEDSILLQWSGRAQLAIHGAPVNLQRQSNGDMVLDLVYQVVESPGGEVWLGMGVGEHGRGLLPVTESIAVQAGQGWQTGRVKLSCFEAAGARMQAVAEPFVLEAEAGLVLQLFSARIAANPGDVTCDL